MFILDTDTCSYILRERPLPVLEKFRKLDAMDICISVITYAELAYGAQRSRSQKVNKEIIDGFTARLLVWEWDKKAAEAYGVLRDALEAKGTLIGNMDLMIAAHALSLNATLVTNNTRHFKQVPKLKLENWV